MTIEDQKKLIQYAIGWYPREGERFCNPFRKDSTPGCRWELRTGYLRMVDWADRRYLNYNCFDFLREAKGITDKKEIGKLLGKLDIDTSADQPKTRTPEFTRIFKWETIPFEDRHREYLQQWFPDATGDSYHGLEAVRWYKYNRKDNPKIWMIDEPQDICFQLPQFMSGNVKFYRPLAARREGKWRSNTSKHDIFFEDCKKQSKELILSKSWMDGKLVRDLTGMDVLAFQSEQSQPSARKVMSLMKSYEKIHILYDTDDAGVKGSEDTKNFLRSIGLNAYKCRWPERIYTAYGITDPREMVMKWGRRITQIAIKKALNNEV